ncbi:uncharacterized protein LOC110715460 [Chenopodium quinoa]|uniref:uncharacterized protein LOC110715460 n=1 Tax=Chenopodium quinoa TaxID=63459 RepID=UPI000B781EBF|nr:uncharacterized protein LOC110715460 [Chenopodium quinoa]
MEPKLEGISRKVWKIVRVAIFMIKKGLCKKKIVMDLNFMMKRRKMAGKKALGNLMFHNNHHLFSTQDGVGGSSNLSNNAREYEFSCSNTPLYHRYFKNQRKNHHHLNNDHYYMPSPFPLEDGQSYNIEDVNNVLEMILRNDKDVGGVSAASPALPGLGFGQSPTVQPLRITDSPFSTRNMDQDDEHVDQAAEDFIKDFYSQLKHQN